MITFLYTNTLVRCVSFALVDLTFSIKVIVSTTSKGEGWLTHVCACLVRVSEPAAAQVICVSTNRICPYLLLVNSCFPPVSVTFCISYSCFLLVLFQFKISTALNTCCKWSKRIFLFVFFVDYFSWPILIWYFFYGLSTFWKLSTMSSSLLVSRRIPLLIFNVHKCVEWTTSCIHVCS